MLGFEYYTPTRVIFGEGAEEKVGELIKADGGSRVLVHYGSGSAKKSGLLDKMLASIAAAGLTAMELGGVQANPRVALVRQGIEMVRDNNLDYLLAVGGGSVIDSAKAIGYGAKTPGDVWDIFAGKTQAAGGMPLGCVLTIAAAGSEMSDSAVITNGETDEKRGYGHPVLGRPRFAAMNPALTLTLPAYQTAAGCTDILMHTLERYFCGGEDSMGLTDDIAEALMRNVMENARKLARNPQDLDARAQIMWAGSLSHNGLTGCGNGGGDWACHQLGHEISGRYDLAHGASLSLVWGSWARYVYKQDAHRFAQLAVNVLDVEPAASCEETALLGIEEMEGFFWGIEMPTSFTEAQLEPDSDAIRQMAQGVTRGGKRKPGAVKALDTDDAIAIYTMARPPAV